MVGLVYSSKDRNQQEVRLREMQNSVTAGIYSQNGLEKIISGDFVAVSRRMGLGDFS